MKGGGEKSAHTLVKWRKLKPACQAQQLLVASWFTELSICAARIKLSRSDVTSIIVWAMGERSCLVFACESNSLDNRIGDGLDAHFLILANYSYVDTSLIEIVTCRRTGHTR